MGGRGKEGNGDSGGTMFKKSGIGTDADGTPEVADIEPCDNGIDIDIDIDDEEELVALLVLLFAIV